MAITVSIELNRELEIPGSYDEVFELLADVPRSASHFPKVHKLTDLGDNAYRWEMEKVGVDKGVRRRWQTLLLWFDLL